MHDFPSEVIGQTTPGDDKEQITADILEFIRQDGADVVVCSGGMSVDPDDQDTGSHPGYRSTRGHLRSAGTARSHAACCLLRKRRQKECPVLGLPGCVMYAKEILSLICFFPRIMADDEILC